MLDSLVRVSRRAGGNHFVSLGRSRTSATTEVPARDTEAPPGGYPTAVAQVDTPREKHRTRTSRYPGLTLGTVALAYDNLPKQDWFQPLPLQRLQALLTLFPKSFSPFPHGTFMLSVSSPYLALDEIYHPFALQSQGT